MKQTAERVARRLDMTRVGNEATVPVHVHHSAAASCLQRDTFGCSKGIDGFAQPVAEPVELLTRLRRVYVTCAGEARSHRYHVVVKRAALGQGTAAAQGKGAHYFARPSKCTEVKSSAPELTERCHVRNDSKNPLKPASAETRAPNLVEYQYDSMSGSFLAQHGKKVPRSGDAPSGSH